MAMMITNFNKLIQSKIVWGLFIGLVVFAFIAMDMATPNRDIQKTNKDLVGNVFGDDITRGELLGSYYSIYLENTLNTGRELNIDDATHENMMNAAWERIAIITKARDMGYTATDQEIIQRIQDIIRSISENNQYSADIYAAFTANFLPRYGMNAKLFESFISESIIIEKVVAEIGQNIWIDEEDISEIFHHLNDLITIEYALVEKSNYTADAITQERAEIYYNNQKNDFILPEKVRVNYIQFPIINYTNQINVSEEQIIQVYSNNIERYRISNDSNNTQSSPQYTPLEEVRESLKTSVQLYLGRQKAVDAADLFVANLSEEGSDFESAADKFNLKINNQLPSFSMNEEINVMDTAFKEAAFGLELSDTEYYSDPVRGLENIYVIALQERIPSRLPAFEEIKDQVTIKAQESADDSAYLVSAEEVYEKIESRLNDGGIFKDILKNNKLQLRTTKPYNRSTPLENDYANEIMSQTYTHPEKALIPIDTSDGLLIAYVKERQLADISTLDEQRQQIYGWLEQQKSAEMIQNWKQITIADAEIEIFE